MGRMWVNEGRIDWKTFLIEYLGYTEDKAEDVMNQTIADQIIMNDPTMRGALAKEIMEKLGMERYMKEAAQDMMSQQEMAQTFGQSQPQYRPSEARNPQAAGTLRQVLEREGGGVRQSGAGYMQR